MLSWLTEHGIEVVAAIAGIVAAITGALVLRAGRRIVRVEVMGFRPGQKEWGELQGPQPFLFVKFTAQRNPVRIASGALVARGGHRLQGYGVGLDRQAHENLPEGGDFILTWALTDAVRSDAPRPVPRMLVRFGGQEARLQAAGGRYRAGPGQRAHPGRRARIERITELVSLRVPRSGLQRMRRAA